VGKKTCNGSSGGAPSGSPNANQNSLVSFPMLSVINSALFFLSFLLIFSHNNRDLDFKVFFAFLPFHMKIFMPVSRMKTNLGSRDSTQTATGSKWIDGPAA
jgi:hypothetical protein